MKFLKFFFPFTLFSFLFLAFSTASAERPLITEDLELPEKGKFELEIGSITEDLGGKDKIWTNENTLIIGIHNRIEMDVNITF
ncbi:MAG: hypothetical protein D6734_04090 [Candidatus Schekmanbacteria bacterium]|nr:MAG: hypothetical protein D6734_04090 [Candidatus Schekmanbacteria bacterium]